MSIPAHYKTDPWEPEGIRTIYGTTRGGRVQVQIVGTDHAHGDVEWGAVVNVSDLCGDGWTPITIDHLRKLQWDCEGALRELDGLSDPCGTIEP